MVAIANRCSAAVLWLEDVGTSLAMVLINIINLSGKAMVTQVVLIRSMARTSAGRKFAARALVGSAIRPATMI